MDEPDTPTVMKATYDQEFDLLEVFFQAPEPAITVRVEGDVYMHLGPETRHIVGVTIHRARERHMRYLLPLQGVVGYSGAAVHVPLPTEWASVVIAYLSQAAFAVSPLKIEHTSALYGEQSPDPAPSFWPPPFGAPRITPDRTATRNPAS